MSTPGEIRHTGGVTQLIGIDHVQLAMPPGDDALTMADAFYGAVLGLVRVAKPPVLATRGGAWFTSDPVGAPAAVVVHLGEEDPFVPARKAHPAFLVRDLDALAAGLAAAGHEVRWSDEVPGVRRFHTDDPFGNRIECVQA